MISLKASLMLSADLVRTKTTTLLKLNNAVHIEQQKLSHNSTSWHSLLLVLYIMNCLDLNLMTR